MRNSGCEIENFLHLSSVGATEPLKGWLDRQALLQPASPEPKPINLPTTSISNYMNFKNLQDFEIVRVVGAGALLSRFARQGFWLVAGARVRGC